MTINITEQQMYNFVLVVLAVLQIYQQRQIKKLEKDVAELWSNLGVFVSNVSNELLSIQKDVNTKQDKKTG